MRAESPGPEQGQTDSEGIEPRKPSSAASKPFWGAFPLSREGILEREKRDPEQGRKIVAEHSFKNKETSKVQPSF